MVMRDLGCACAMNLDGGASRALYYRGQVLASPGRALTNVLLIRERPLALPPPERAAEAHYQAGLNLKREGHLQAAAASFLLALRHDTNHVAAHYALAWTHVALHEKAEAIREFREVLRLEPEGERAAESRRVLAGLAGEEGKEHEP
jgi:tetratricopeptide (TPR) repeat protein